MLCKKIMKQLMPLLEIDGSQKSGSGTIVRYCCAIASLLNKNIHLFNIREKREKKGLRPQHLKAIEACAEITNGKLQNAYVGSNEIFYYPGKEILAKNYTFDIGTAGSTTMLSQTIMPILLFAKRPTSIKIIGGLFQDFAPAAHHLMYVVLPLLKTMNIDISLKIIKPGYVPKGQGIIELNINPVKNYISPITLDNQGYIKEIIGTAISSNLKESKVSQRMASSFAKEIVSLNIQPEIELIYDETAHQKGASLTCWIKTSTNCLIGMDMAGKIGRTSEEIGKTVAYRLIEDFKTKATVDRYTADQLILYCALAKGKSSYIIPEMTEHIETNLWLIKTILNADYEIFDNKLTINGIGFKNQSSIPE
jgi:RNA 3'-terminal phosphate cyclase (ATP)